MIEAFNLGPLLIPTRPLLLLLGLVFAIWCANRLAKKFDLARIQVQRAAEYTAWTGLVGARLAFVAVNWSAYRTAPWTIFYLWQPGYLFLGGLLFGGACILWQSLKRATDKRKTFAAVLTGSYLTAGILYFGAIGSLELLRQPGTPASGNPAPEIRFEDLSAAPVSLSEFAGRAVVLNFWATWCPPCRREMPMLDEFHAAYSSRGLSVIGLAIDEPPAQVRRFVESIGVSYPIWVDAPPSAPGFDRSRQVFSRYGGVGLPTTVFIDRKGIIRRIYVGELSRGFLHSQAEIILAK